MNLKEIKSLLRKILPVFIIQWYHFSLVLLSAVIYRYPSKKIKVIGITGTNGKSTTVEMVTRVLEEAGFKVAVSSSVKFKVGNKEWLNVSRMTMPGRFFLQKLLRMAINEKCQYVVIEVSSEGIKQYRHKFINFHAVIITNVTPEHIESHGNFENYLHAKGELFNACNDIHIINADDKNKKYFVSFKSDKKYLYTLSKILNMENKNSMVVTAENLKITQSGSSFIVNGVEFNLKLLGKFNVYNALAAICLAMSQGINLNVCKIALNKMKKFPGRMEEIIKDPFHVLIDYAVTPDSLEKAYQTIKECFKGSRMICVLGSCGGGRDKWKRPVLGRVSALYCDETIVTNEDPYDEDPFSIINEIAGNNSKFKKILDRREAIREALLVAKKGDVVIITGKGCESSMCLAEGKKIPWSDRKVIIEEYSKIT